MTAAPSSEAFAAAASRRKPGGQTSTAPPLVGQRKYTVLLDDDLADSVDVALMKMRRQTGHKVDRSAVVRELLAMLTDDPTLLGAVAERLARQGI